MQADHDAEESQLDIFYYTQIFNFLSGVKDPQQREKLIAMTRAKHDAARYRRTEVYFDMGNTTDHSRVEEIMERAKCAEEDNAYYYKIHDFLLEDRSKYIPTLLEQTRSKKDRLTAVLHLAEIEVEMFE